MDEVFNGVFVKYYSKLIQQLPINDAVFRSQLYSNKLLPGNLKEEIQAKSTKADKAEHFLDNAIKYSAPNFKKLIALMLKYDDVLQKTATDIKKKMEGNGKQ